MVGVLRPWVPTPGSSTRPSQTWFKNSSFRRRRPPAAAAARSSSGEGEEEEEKFQVLTALNTQHNRIVVLDTPKSRMLLLDSTHNIHSVYNKEEGKWTGSYWDEFVTLPAIVPQGPIAILGLGGGTAAHLMLHSWPSLCLHGWEIDDIVVDSPSMSRVIHKEEQVLLLSSEATTITTTEKDFHLLPTQLIHKSREYFGLSDLERSTQTGGLLTVHVGDALCPSACVPGGFAGIVVDLFSEGKVLRQLQEVPTWLALKNKLMSNGRIMVNCGGADAQTIDFMNRTTPDNSSSNDGLWIQNSAIKALCRAFPGNLSWKVLRGDGENYLALTGPFPDVDAWSATVPSKLSINVKQWKPCHISA